MSDTIIPLHRKKWMQSPLIAGALEAVSAAKTLCHIHVTNQVARRVYFPAYLVSLEGVDFFEGSRPEIADRVYLKAAHYLETLLREEPFLS